jgi:hypothetical protein
VLKLLQQRLHGPQGDRRWREPAGAARQSPCSAQRHGQNLKTISGIIDRAGLDQVNITAQSPSLIVQRSGLSHVPEGPGFLYIGTTTAC